MFQILIVEDDKELSQLFQKVLEKNGYQVKSASDGALALEILDKEYIDLIISDIMMPVMDGYELVSELRSAGYQIHKTHHPYHSSWYGSAAQLFYEVRGHYAPVLYQILFLCPTHWQLIFPGRTCQM